MDELKDDKKGLSLIKGILLGQFKLDSTGGKGDRLDPLSYNSIQIHYELELLADL